MRGYSLTFSSQALGANDEPGLIEFTADASHSYYIAKAWVSQDNQAAVPDNQQVFIAKMLGASNTCSVPNVSQLDPDDPASLISARGFCANNSGVANFLLVDSFDWQKGWVYIPMPSERIIVTGGAIISLAASTGAISYTVDCGMILVEVG